MHKRARVCIAYVGLWAGRARATYAPPRTPETSAARGGVVGGGGTAKMISVSHSLPRRSRDPSYHAVGLVIVRVMGRYHICGGFLLPYRISFTHVERVNGNIASAAACMMLDCIAQPQERRRDSNVHVMLNVQNNYIFEARAPVRSKGLALAIQSVTAIIIYGIHGIFLSFSLCCVVESVGQ